MECLRRLLTLALLTPQAFVCTRRSAGVSVVLQFFQVSGCFLEWRLQLRFSGLAGVVYAALRWAEAQAAVDLLTLPALPALPQSPFARVLLRAVAAALQVSLALDCLGCPGYLAAGLKMPSYQVTGQYYYFFCRRRLAYW